MDIRASGPGGKLEEQRQESAPIKPRWHCRFGRCASLCLSLFGSFVIVSALIHARRCRGGWGVFVSDYRVIDISHVMSCHVIGLIDPAPKDPERSLRPPAGGQIQGGSGLPQNVEPRLDAAVALYEAQGACVVPPSVISILRVPLHLLWCYLLAC